VTTHAPRPQPDPAVPPRPTKAQIYRELWIVQKGNAEATAAALRDLGYRCSGQHVRNVNREYEVNRKIPTRSMVRLRQAMPVVDVEPSFERAPFDLEALLTAPCDITRGHHEATTMADDMSSVWPAAPATTTVVFPMDATTKAGAVPDVAFPGRMHAATIGYPRDIDRTATYHIDVATSGPSLLIDNLLLVLMFGALVVTAALATTGARPAGIALLASWILMHVAAEEQRRKRKPRASPDVTRWRLDALHTNTTRQDARSLAQDR
jgi:hypothetical protein